MAPREDITGDDAKRMGFGTVYVWCEFKCLYPTLARSILEETERLREGAKESKKALQEAETRVKEKTFDIIRCSDDDLSVDAFKDFVKSTISKTKASKKRAKHSTSSRHDQEQQQEGSELTEQALLSQGTSQSTGAAPNSGGPSQSTGPSQEAEGPPPTRGQIITFHLFTRQQGSQTMRYEAILPVESGMPVVTQALQDEVDRLRQLVEGLEEEARGHNAWKTENRGLKKENEALKHKVAELETELQSLKLNQQQDLLMLREENEELKHQNVKLRGDIETLLKERREDSSSSSGARRKQACIRIEGRSLRETYDPEDEEKRDDDEKGPDGPGPYRKHRNLQNLPWKLVTIS